MKSKILILAFFVLLSIIATYPLIIHFDEQLFGNPTDNLAAVWNFWWVKTAVQQNISDLYIPMLAAPYGVDVSATPYYPVWNYMNARLALLMGEIATYNIQILLGFIFSGFCMAYMIYRFTKKRTIALIVGTIFTLSPYHFAQAFEYLALSNMQWMIIYVISLFNLKRKTNYLNGIICAVALAMIGFFDYYYLYFMIIFTGVFLVYCAWYYRKQLNKNIFLKKIKVILFSAMVHLIVLVPGITHIIFPNKSAQVIAQPSGVDFVRPLNHLFADSARVLNYFLPAPFHPVLGKITEPLIGTFLYGDNFFGNALYLGYVGIFLAFVCISRWRKESALEKKDRIGEEDNFTISFFFAAFFIFMIFSFPPYWQIGKVMIPFPSFFLYKIVPMFRNYARMGVLVLISVCVLSGFGLKYIFKSIRESKKRLALSGVFFMLIFLEFLPFPPARIVDCMNIPAAYQWLKEDSTDFIIAEYPLEADERLYLFYQRIHAKKMINGAMPGTYAYEVRSKILDIENEQTSMMLSFLGAKYVLIHRDSYLNYEGGQVLGQIPNLNGVSGLKLLKKFEDIDIYEVIASPLDPRKVVVRKKSMEKKSFVAEEIIPANGVFKFKPGDSLKYTVKYFNLIPALNVQIDMCREANNLENEIILKAKIHSTKMFSYLVNFQAVFNSFFDRKYLSPFRYEESYGIVGQKPRSKYAVFDRGSQVMRTSDKEVKIPPHTQDPISIIFFLSSQKFELGKKIEINLNPGKSNYKVEAEVLGKDKISVLGRKKYAWKVGVTLFRGKKEQKKNAEAILWFSVTDKQELLALRASTKIGVFNMDLRK
ncbi:MAG: DUF3108 domain-containing protein [PVC group bacterium]|nr:DUF3108 domain-containing protein [PVC group bacterium]